jgi:plastocyanin
MSLRYLAAAALSLPLLALVGACGDDDESKPDPARTEAPETIDVEMTLEDFSFDPASIEIDFRDEIFLELANDGETAHSFTVDEFLVDEELESGQDADVSFTPNEPGEFTYYCRFHPEQMLGSLLVLADGATPEADAETTPDSGSDNEGGGAGIGY